ncbi:MAG: hypothetical protein NVV59_10385 [Chitinophagaceae bacterium]|nr:hypothetical protein [Chitinophagaceae bacterium]
MSFAFYFLLGLLQPTQTVMGSWEITNGDDRKVLMIRDNYFSISHFNVTTKQFFHSFGGTFKYDGTKASIVIEFDTKNADNIGTKHEATFTSANDQLTFSVLGYGATWKQTDNGNAALAGNWRISGRLEGGNMNSIPKRDRKTLKLLTGNRFQWMAINPVSKEFFGTGGGTYTFVNGKYTETIEFFSRDSTRVGASLQFDGKVEGDNWYHSGKSSKGEDLNEVWSREK